MEKGDANLRTASLPLYCENAGFKRQRSGSKLMQREYVPLVSSLVDNEDIWECICNCLNGDALHRIAQVQYFKQSTIKTPAFICLSGLNNDAQLVPWNDDDNILSPHYIHHPLSHGRIMWSIIAADYAFRTLQYPIYPRNYQMGGPARPTTPMPNNEAADIMREGVDAGVIAATAMIAAHARPLSSLYPAVAERNTLASTYTLSNPRCHDYVHRFSLMPPVFGVRNGFTSGPFWDVVTGDMMNSSSDED